MSNLTTESILSALGLDADNEGNLKAVQGAITGQVKRLVGKYLQANKSETEKDLDFELAMQQARLRMRVAKATLSDRIESRYAEQLALAQRRASANTAEKQLLGVKEPVVAESKPAPKKAKKAKDTKAPTVSVEPPTDPIVATIQ